MKAMFDIFMFVPGEWKNHENVSLWKKYTYQGMLFFDPNHHICTFFETEQTFFFFML